MMMPFFGANSSFAFLSQDAWEFSIGGTVKSLEASATMQDALAALEDTEAVLCIRDGAYFAITKLSIFASLWSSNQKPLSTEISAILETTGSVKRVPNMSLWEVMCLFLSEDPPHRLLVRVPTGGDCWFGKELLLKLLVEHGNTFTTCYGRSLASTNKVNGLAKLLHVHEGEGAMQAVALLPYALEDQTAVAVISVDGKLVGELSEASVSQFSSNDSLEHAISTLTAGGLLDSIFSSSGTYGNFREKVCYPETSVFSAIQLAVDAKASYLWVVESMETMTLTGLVSLLDIIRVLKEEIPPPVIPLKGYFV